MLRNGTQCWLFIARIYCAPLRRFAPALLAILPAHCLDIEILSALGHLSRTHSASRKAARPVLRSEMVRSIQKGGRCQVWYESFFLRQLDAFLGEGKSADTSFSSSTSLVSIFFNWRFLLRPYPPSFDDAPLYIWKAPPWFKIKTAPLDYQYTHTQREGERERETYHRGVSTFFKYVNIRH